MIHVTNAVDAHLAVVYDPYSSTYEVVKDVSGRFGNGDILITAEFDSLSTTLPSGFRVYISTEEEYM